MSEKLNIMAIVRASRKLFVASSVAIGTNNSTTSHTASCAKKNQISFFIILMR